ncbi:hypothetical protein BpHYR1_034052 [Brachionus plicatilis]|uniref:Uncharacterized protein n=1 Tax=Brachionus plicatilis TaxID=10195 RepID=A0A3M7PKH1_BRAPC|nr:hypothetical protein BpHYR1_034052 [Brachionus plicatilis]
MLKAGIIGPQASTKFFFGTEQSLKLLKNSKYIYYRLEIFSYSRLITKVQFVRQVVLESDLNSNQDLENIDALQIISQLFEFSSKS